jgi:hypothetical protein
MDFAYFRKNGRACQFAGRNKITKPRFFNGRKLIPVAGIIGRIVFLLLSSLFLSFSNPLWQAHPSLVFWFAGRESNNPRGAGQTTR